jgi:hypothetical protein
MKVVIIPYILSEHKRICLNILLFITKFIIENTVVIVEVKISDFLKTDFGCMMF